MVLTIHYMYNTIYGGKLLRVNGITQAVMEDALQAKIVKLMVGEDLLANAEIGSGGEPKISPTKAKVKDAVRGARRAKRDANKAMRP